MPKENYSIKLEKDTKNTLSSINPDIVRKVLDSFTCDYDKYMGNTELLFKELAVARVDNEIKSHEETIKELKEYKIELLEDLEELRQVQRKEKKALGIVWDKLCLLVEEKADTGKTYDYNDVYRKIKDSYMPDDDIIMFCKDKLHKLIKPLEEIQNRSSFQTVTLKQWQYLLKQIERIEKSTFIDGVEIKQIEKETQNTKKAGSGANGK